MASANHVSVSSREKVRDTIGDAERVSFNSGSGLAVANDSAFDEVSRMPLMAKGAFEKSSTSNSPAPW